MMKDKHEMPDNTKVNQIISDEHQPASMQMNRRFYLICRDKNFLISFQFTFWLFQTSSFLIAKVNPTWFLVTFRLRNMD